jgi:Fic family protein
MNNRLLETVKEEKNMHLRGGIYHQTQVEFAYNSNRIEGSRLSEEQTRYIFETNTIDVKPGETADVDDIIETVNHFSCFDHMIDTVSEELSENLIKEYHKILNSNTSASRKDWFRVGDYKAKPNAIGEVHTTAPGKVGQEMKNILDSYNKKNITFEDIVDFHYKFERIHPFQDGNGRVGRMIMFKECLAHNILPFIIDSEYKLFYYRGLKEYGSVTGYLVDTCRSAQDEYKKPVRYFLPDG